jgi:hypothetical protein
MPATLYAFPMELRVALQGHTERLLDEALQASSTTSFEMRDAYPQRRPDDHSAQRSWS